MRRWCPAPATALLVVLLGMMGSGLWWLDSIHSGIKAVLHEYRKPQESKMQTLESTVTNQDGLEIKVVTPRDGTETQAEQLARHLSMCDLALTSGGTD